MQQQNLGLARLVCRQWAAKLPHGCTRLKVKEKQGPDSWEHRSHHFHGLEELSLVGPKNVGKSLPELRGLCMETFVDKALLMLRSLLPVLTFLNFTFPAYRILGLRSSFTSPASSPSTRHTARTCRAEGAQAHVYPDLSQPAILLENHGCGAGGAWEHACDHLPRPGRRQRDYGCGPEGAT